MPIPLKNPLPEERLPESSKKPRSIIGKAFRGTQWLATGPADWVGTRRIRRGLSFIGDLFGILRRGPLPEPRFKTEGPGIFDLQATAFSYGVPVAQLEAQLRARQRHTARVAYVTFVLAWMFLAGWVWQSLTTPWTAMRVTSCLYFLPFCGLLFLMSFHNALLNFQIRSRRLASWRDYISTDERFWPG